MIKTFKSDIPLIPYEEQKKLLELKKQYFWAFLPETELILLDGDEWVKEERKYFVKQKFIKGRMLKNIDIHTLSPQILAQLLELLFWYLRYAKETGNEIDLTGDQGYTDIKYAWERRFKNFLLMYKNFLYSTNIIISDEGKVFMVDVCESRILTSPYRKIKNFFAKPFIKLTLHKIAKLIQAKNVELAGVLQAQKKNSEEGYSWVSCN